MNGNGFYLRNVTAFGNTTGCERTLNVGTQHYLAGRLTLVVTALWVARLMSAHVSMWCNTGVGWHTCYR